MLHLQVDRRFIINFDTASKTWPRVSHIEFSAKAVFLRHRKKGGSIYFNEILRTEITGLVGNLQQQDTACACDTESFNALNSLGFGVWCQVFVISADIHLIEGFTQRFLGYPIEFFPYKVRKMRHTGTFNYSVWAEIINWLLGLISCWIC